MHATALVDGLKREMKARGITYADLAAALAVSEATVKRMFAQKSFTLQRLDETLAATGISLEDITRAEAEEERLISRLTLEQEREIVSDPKIFLLAVAAMNMVSLEHSVTHYRIEKTEAILALARLDKIGFLQLLPNNKTRLLISRTFSWIPNGPIQAYFKALASSDYLDAPFDGEDEMMVLQNMMLSKTSLTALKSSLRQVAREYAKVHQDEIKLPLSEKRPVSMLIAARPWLPKPFKALLREGGDSK